jgi:uncharacterized RmlC-like cupin family protein
MALRPEIARRGFGLSDVAGLAGAAIAPHAKRQYLSRRIPRWRPMEARQMSEQVRPILTKRGSESADTGQSGGAVRITGVGTQNSPATKIWFGKASNEPGFRSLPHHHGEAETGVYLLSGRARIYYGDDYQQFVEMTEGDFAFVPPHMPHVEANMSTTEELWWVVCRTPENIVVNLADIADGALPGYRRS